MGLDMWLTLIIRVREGRHDFRMDTFDMCIAFEILVLHWIRF